MAKDAESIRGLSAVASATLSNLAAQDHRILAEVSHITALAADRLQQGAVGQGVDVAEIPIVQLDAILKMLRDAQNMAHAAYLKAHGDEADYQAARKRLARKYPEPKSAGKKVKR